MTDRETILGAGKRIAATAAGRAFKEGSPKVKAEDLLNDPSLERQGEPGRASSDHPGAAEAKKQAEKESQSEPGNPNDVDPS